MKSEKSRSGMMLLEVLLALGILSASIMLLLDIFPSALAFQQKSMDRSRSIFLAQQIMEIMLNETMSQMYSIYTLPGGQGKSAWAKVTNFSVDATTPGDGRYFYQVETSPFGDPGEYDNSKFPTTSSPLYNDAVFDNTLGAFYARQSGYRITVLVGWFTQNPGVGDPQNQVAIATIKANPAFTSGVALASDASAIGTLTTCAVNKDCVCEGNDGTPTNSNCSNPCFVGTGAVQTIEVKFDPSLFNLTVFDNSHSCSGGSPSVTIYNKLSLKEINDTGGFNGGTNTMGLDNIQIVDPPPLGTGTETNKVIGAAEDNTSPAGCTDTRPGATPGIIPCNWTLTLLLSLNHDHQTITKPTPTVSGVLNLNQANTGSEKP